MLGKDDCVEVEMGVRLPSGAFKRNIFTDVNEIPTVRKQYKNKGVYVSAYRYTNARKKSESLLYGPFYIDLDAPDMKDSSKETEAFEQIRADGIKAISFLSAICHIDEDMIRIYYSGQKGLHIVVPAKIFGIDAKEDLNMIYGLIAKEIHNFSKYKTIDTRIYDNARLFSLPGYIHPETGRHKIPLTFDELRNMPFAKIKEMSKQKRKLKYKEPRYNTKANRIFKTYIEDWEKLKRDQAKKDGKAGARKMDFTPPCIKSMLENPCGQGGRNNTAAAIIAHFRLRGYSEKKAWNKLEEWNDEFAQLPQKELDTTFKSLFYGEYEYGCQALEQLGICDKANCKIGRSILKKQQEGDKK